MIHEQKEIVGDILVFLAGMKDILTAQNYLQKIYGDQFIFQILHGDLSMEDQLKIFAPSLNKQKIIHPICKNHKPVSLSLRR